MVDAGVAIADAEGLEALSIRKVAGRLGIGAMSVYTYVPGRSELIELMIDRVYAEHGLPDPALGWRARVEEWMRATWRIYSEHPWLLDHNMARLPIGPHVLDVEEAFYAAVHAAGFTGAENVTVSNLLRWQLIGAARSMISDAAEERHTGVSAEAYWESRSSFWTTYFDCDAVSRHGSDLGGRWLRRPGRLRLRADDHLAAGRHRAAGRPGEARQSGLTSVKGLARVATAEDAAEIVFAVVLRRERVDLPVVAPVLPPQHPVRHLDGAEPA